MPVFDPYSTERNDELEPKSHNRLVRDIKPPKIRPKKLNKSHYSVPKMCLYCGHMYFSEEDMWEHVTKEHK